MSASESKAKSGEHRVNRNPVQETKAGDAGDGESAEEAQARLAAIVEWSDDAIISKDLNGVITSWNRGAQRIFGYTAEEAIGQSITMLIPEGHLDEEPRILERIRSGQAIDHYETVRRRKDGELIDISLTVSPIIDRQGRIVGASKIARNVTERRRLDDALRARTEQYETLLNAAPVGVFVLDGELRLCDVNPTARQAFGDLPDLIGREFGELARAIWPPPYVDLSLAQFQHTLKTGESFTVPEFSERRLDRGVMEHYESHIHRIRLPDGRLGVVCYFRDISAQVRAREQIIESGRRLRFVMDSMPQKIFTATPSGDVDYFNPAWMEFTGLSFEQIRDWGWTQFIHPEDVGQNVRVWRHSIETGKPFQFEHRFRRADGQYRWHLSRAVALKDESGNVLMWVGANTDVHEQKETADELHRLAADLSRADRRKDEFLATLAHELRNPLAPLRNSLAILRLPGAAPAAEGLHEMMERQVTHMVRLVDDLLEISRITRGKIELRKEKVELAAVIRAAIETSQPAIEAAGHQLSVDLPQEPVWLEADPVRLAQVFSNLLNNAAKYTESGGQIRLAARPADGDVVISVCDTGIGIPAEMLPKVFEMFTQVNRHLKRAQGGLGIGLTLARQLVGMHGGVIEAHSAGAGQGSEFVVRLPVVATPRPDPAASPLWQPAPRRRVLVVDDNRDAADSLSMLLRFMGLEARVAYDGHAALEAIRADRPAAVLLDLGMPGIDGFEVARRVRRDPELRDVMLVALTGWGQDEDHRRSQEAGFDHHLVKPVDQALLGEILADPNARHGGARLVN